MIVTFAAVVSAAIGFTIATSTTGFSSLEETRSFTIPIHTTDIIPTTVTTHTGIILTDTVAFGTVAFATVTFTTVAFTAVFLTAVAPIEVVLTGDR